MPYDPIRLLGGGRKHTRFYYYDPTNFEYGPYDFESKVTIKHLFEGKLIVMENGELVKLTYGHRVFIDLTVFNVSSSTSDEADILTLYQFCGSINSNFGSLYIIPNYDSLYTQYSQNVYKVVSVGNHEWNFTHDFLATMQEFKFQFKGVKFTSPMPKRVLLDGTTPPGAMPLQFT